MPGRRLRLGVLASAGGSALFAARAVLPEMDLVVVTDRACGIEAAAAAHGIPCTRIVEADRARFGERVARHYRAQGPLDAVLLFYARLVGPELYRSLPCVNVHPSLLPAFPGMGAVRRAVEAGAPALGATAHLVDAGTDAGPILAQVTSPLPRGASLRQAEQLSFVQKAALTVIVCQLFAQGRVRIDPGASRLSVRPGHASTAFAHPVPDGDLWREAVARLATTHGVSLT